MTDLPPTDWMNQWQSMSRRYLSAWQQMARAPDAPPTFGMPAWPQGFEQIAKGFPAGGSVQNGAIEHLMDSAKRYSAFMQAMLGATMQDNAAPDWGDALRKGFASMGGDAGGAMPANMFDHPAMRQWQAVAGQGVDPLAQLRAAMGNLRMPGISGLGDIKSMLGMPAFGLMREHQEHQQKSLIAWVEYQEQMTRYNALMLKASQRGFELFEGKLIEREQPGRQIDSMRALYDLWVDAAEDGYAEIALSTEFREVYGAMVNAQMRVRSQVQQEVERVATDFGMPTRSEINSIGERLQALRREVRGKVSDDGIAAELASLRAEVAQLRASAKRKSRSATVELVAESNPPVRSQVVASRRKRVTGKKAPVDRAAGKTSPALRAVEESQPISGPRAARQKKAAAKPGKSKKRKGDKRGKRTQKAVAASATGSFASRVQKFANASRDTGNPRTTWKLAEKSAGPKKSGH